MSALRVTPLCDAPRTCYLLEMDEARLLLGCGASLDILEKMATTVDAVLLAHSTLDHVASLPLFQHAAVYATLPTQLMGQVALMDRIHAMEACGDACPWTVEHVSRAFESIHTVKFSQPMALFGRCAGITITAYPAGHTVGGVIWRISKESDVVVFAVDVNHKKEKHLNGASHLVNASGELARASVLVMDSACALEVHSPRKLRDAALIENIMATIASQGNVLIPVDASSRVLEVSYLLEQHWIQHRIQTPILFLAPYAKKTLHHAKGILEWMGDGITAQFSASRQNPFEFQCIQSCESLQEFYKVEGKGPVVVLASDATMSHGSWSREVWSRWATDGRHSLIMTERVAQGTLANELHDMWLQAVPESEQDDSVNKIIPAMPLATEMRVEVRRNVALEGSELEAYRWAKQQEMEAKRAQDALSTKSKEMMESGSEDEGSDDETSLAPRRRSSLGMSLVGHNAQADAFQDMFTTENFDFPMLEYTSRHRPSFFRPNHVYPTFPVHDQRSRFDDYGEVANMDVYTRDMDRATLTLGASDGRTQFGTRRESHATSHADAGPKKAITAREAERIPTKQVVEWHSMVVQCKVQYVNVEGRADGRSIKMMLSQLAPRKLALVHADVQECEHLAEYCRGVKDFTHDILIPAVGESISVSSSTNTYQMTLTDALLSTLDLSEAGDYELAYVSGRITYGDDAAVPSLEPLPQEDVPVHAGNFVGNVKLADLKQAVESRAGMRARFIGDGMLACNESVRLRKLDANTLEMSGTLNDDYFKVRKLLYTNHAVL